MKKSPIVFTALVALMTTVSAYAVGDLDMTYLNEMGFKVTDLGSEYLLEDQNCYAKQIALFITYLRHFLYLSAGLYLVLSVVNYFRGKEKDLIKILIIVLSILGTSQILTPLTEVMTGKNIENPTCPKIRVSKDTSVKEISKKLSGGLSLVEEVMPSGGNVNVNMFNGVGDLSAKYESRGRYDIVGYDTAGGCSYGKYQLAVRVSSLSMFLKYLAQHHTKYYETLQSAGGIQDAYNCKARDGNIGKFEGAFLNLARQKDFQNIMEQHHNEAFGKPMFRRINDSRKLPQGIKDKINNSFALQSMAFSLSTQHGPGGGVNVISKAVANYGLTESSSKQEIARAVYAERRKVNQYFRASNDAVKNAVYNRFIKEERDVLALIESKG